MFLNDHLPEWKPVLFELQNRYHQVLDAVAVKQNSDNYKKNFSLFLPPAVQQLSSILQLPAVQQYTATASSTAVATANSTIECYMCANSLGKIIISSTKMFA